MAGEKGPNGLVRVLRRGLEGLGMLALRQAGRGAAADLDAVSDLVYGLLTRIWPYRKKVIQKNGRLALGLEGEGLEAFTKGFYRHFGNVLSEALAAFGMTVAQIRSRMEWDAEEFDQAIAANPVVVALTAHQGNWEWQIVGGSERFPAHLLGVYQHLSQRFFEQAMMGLRSKGGAIPTSQLQILRKLATLPKHQNSILAMVADQAPPIQGALVLPFLNTQTGFFAGPQSLAARLKAPTFYLSMLPGKFRHTYKTTATRLTPGREVEEYVHLLEADIRASPTTYLWSHNRFKHQYGEEIAKSVS